MITTGPYKVMRHPGYLVAVLFYIGVPLLFGSIYGFIPGAIAIVLTITRTALEDRTLYKELTGYKEYAKSTRYRLIPFIW